MFDNLRDSWKNLTKHIISYLVAFLIGIVVAVLLFFNVETVSLFMQLVNLFFILMLFFRINLRTPKIVKAVNPKPKTAEAPKRIDCPECHNQFRHSRTCSRKVK